MNKDWLEQYAAQVGQALTLAVLTWVGYSIVQMQKDVVVLQTQMDAVETTLRQGIDDRYRGSDARRDLEAVYHSMDRIDQRLQRVEAEVFNHKGE